MAHFAISAVGRDRPGIVSEVTRVLLEHEVNIEDSQMTILRGHFTMMLVVSASDELDEEALGESLDEVADELELEAITLAEVGDVDPSEEAQPSHIITVYGVDHIGIVHAVAQAMADNGVDITDLNSRLVSDEAEPLYALMMEVALPADMDAARLEEGLRAVGEDQGVEVTLRELEQDAL